jgi:D-alanyl-lipoteichoic acid acyltransferase DltB (MBOAT superfamily)
MLFSSFTFLFQFLPSVILAFAAARLHSPRAGIVVLASASLVFYGAWNPPYLILFVASIAANYALGRWMERSAHSRTIGSVGVALNLAALGYFKYLNFLIDTLNQLPGVSLSVSSTVLPIGISFFTFQQIAYLVDVMRGAPVERSIVNYALFVSFFPHLIAGPLVHHAEMIPQFRRTRAGSSVMVAQGGAVFVAGLFKKVVVADGLAQFVSPVFAHTDTGGGVTAAWAWLATLAYTLQIYYDFSGYSDMAIGLALLFGIRLPVNFRSPYKATSIIDFWRRWHITLSRFLRDYLYIPLGGNRHGERRRYANLLVTMLLGGFWHGAGWNFVVWGGLHGSYLAVNHIWRATVSPAGSGANDARPALATVAGWIGTFTAVVLAWVFFRANSLSSAWSMIRGLGGAGTGDQVYVSPGVLRIFGLPLYVGADSLQLIGLAAVGSALLAALALPNVIEIVRYREFRRAPDARYWLRWRPNAASATAIAVMAALAMFGMWQRIEFLYFQF